jgi:hypothetical protein
VACSGAPQQGAEPWRKCSVDHRWPNVDLELAGTAVVSPTTLCTSAQHMSEQTDRQRGTSTRAALCAWIPDSWSDSCETVRCLAGRSAHVTKSNRARHSSAYRLTQSNTQRHRGRCSGEAALSCARPRLLVDCRLPGVMRSASIARWHGGNAQRSVQGPTLPRKGSTLQWQCVLLLQTAT